MRFVNLNEILHFFGFRHTDSRPFVIEWWKVSACQDAIFTHLRLERFIVHASLDEGKVGIRFDVAQAEFVTHLGNDRLRFLVFSN